MTAIAAIHVAKKQLGLDEDTYRSLLTRVTGEASTKAMSERQRQAVVDELRRLGFKPAKKRLEGPFAKKLQALWIGAFNLGIVKDRRDQAMLAFVARQTGIQHTRFLLDAEEAAKAIDALKAWMAREAGVDWTLPASVQGWRRMPGAKIALAQWALLASAGAVRGDAESFRAWVEARAFNPLARMSDKEWAGIMNTLGGWVRKAVRR